MLSHWHRDHSGGILEVLRTAKPTKPITVDLHPSRPIARGIALPPDYKKVLARLPDDPTFEEIENLGGRVDLRDDPHTVGGGTVFVSGEIPRVIDWEEGLFGGVTWVATSENDGREAVGEVLGDFKWVAEPVSLGFKETIRHLTLDLVITGHNG